MLSVLFMLQIFIIYNWFKASSQSQTARELDFNNNKTICSWAKILRAVCIYQVYFKCNPIGGENSVVEIVESKFGKSK